MNNLPNLETFGGGGGWLPTTSVQLASLAIIAGFIAWRVLQ